MIAIIAGATLNMRGRKATVKAAGTGFVVFGLYDLLVQNVPALQAYLPSISGPSFLAPAAPAEQTSGAMNYGRSVMGASINDTGAEVVGASNIQAGMSPEVIGCDYSDDINEALEMGLD